MGGGLGARPLYCKKKIGDNMKYLFFIIVPLILVQACNTNEPDHSMISPLSAIKIESVQINGKQVTTTVTYSIGTPTGADNLFIIAGTDAGPILTGPFVGVINETSIASTGIGKELKKYVLAMAPPIPEPPNPPIITLLNCSVFKPCGL